MLGDLTKQIAHAKALDATSVTSGYAYVPHVDADKYSCLKTYVVWAVVKHGAFDPDACEHAYQEACSGFFRVIMANRATGENRMLITTLLCASVVHRMFEDAKARDATPACFAHFDDVHWFEKDARDDLPVKDDDVVFEFPTLFAFLNNDLHEVAFSRIVSVILDLFMHASSPDVHFFVGARRLFASEYLPSRATNPSAAFWHADAHVEGFLGCFGIDVVKFSKSTSVPRCVSMLVLEVYADATPVSELVSFSFVSDDGTHVLYKEDAVQFVVANAHALYVFLPPGVARPVFPMPWSEARALTWPAISLSDAEVTLAHKGSEGRATLTYFCQSKPSLSATA